MRPSPEAAFSRPSDARPATPLRPPHRRLIGRLSTPDSRHIAIARHLMPYWARCHAAAID